MTALILATPQDALQRLVAYRGISDETVEMFHSGRMPVEGNTSYAARAIIEGRVVQSTTWGRATFRSRAARWCGPWSIRSASAA